MEQKPVDPYAKLELLIVLETALYGIIDEQKHSLHPHKTVQDFLKAVLPKTQPKDHAMIHTVVAHSVIDLPQESGSGSQRFVPEELLKTLRIIQRGNLRQILQPVRTALRTGSDPELDIRMQQLETLPGRVPPQSDHLRASITRVLAEEDSAILPDIVARLRAVEQALIRHQEEYAQRMKNVVQEPQQLQEPAPQQEPLGWRGLLSKLPGWRWRKKRE